MTNELEDALSKHLKEEQVDPICGLLRSASSFAEGDALSGAALEKLSDQDYETVNRVFEEAGFDISFNNKMSFVDFVSEPETKDPELNEAIREL